MKPMQKINISIHPSVANTGRRLKVRQVIEKTPGKSVTYYVVVASK